MLRARRALLLAAVAGLAGALLTASDARSRSVIRHKGGFHAPARFALLGLPVGKTRAPAGTRPAVSLAGAPVVALAGGALVIDPDSGRLLRTDPDGAVVARLAIAPDAAQVAVDRARGRAYVASRRDDRIAVVSLAGGRLTLERTIATPAEPYGLALTPDGRRLLVTTIADRALVAYAADSGEELWRAPLPPEPRGVAVSPDGRQVAVAFLTTGALARGALPRTGPPRLEQVALHQGAPASPHRLFHTRPVPAGVAHPDVAATGAVRDQRGESFARAAFTVAFIGHGIAIVPHQVSTPHQDEGAEDTGGYGGGSAPPITHQVAFVAGAPGQPRLATASLAVHQPRAVAYDAGRDRLYLFGYGSDSVTVLGAASQSSIHLVEERALGVSEECGATGAAVADDGRVLVFCSLSRKLAVLDGLTAGARAALGPELAPSRLTAEQRAGRALFRKGGDHRMSRGGAMACESCHPEARTDGLSWRIESKVLQTPLLAGRIAGTHPYKWDGGDRTLSVSLGATVRRLGGHGIGATEVKQLAAYLESLPPPRTPRAGDRAAVARGKALFRSRQVGCATCHGGAQLTDRRRHPLSHDIDATDTPSLIGLAGSAPYFHDGSAATLEALLTDRGSVHGMGRTAALSERQLADLVAYLETL